MSALTGERNTFQVDAQGVPASIGPYGVKTAVKIWRGGIVVLELSSGLIRPGLTATGLVCLGKCELTADNTSGADSAITGSARCGGNKWGNSSGADAIALANVNQDCWIVDDQTVALTDGQGTRSFAGVIESVDAEGVTVQMAPWLRAQGSGPQPKMVISAAFPDMTKIADGVIFQITPNFAGRITALKWSQNTPVTQANKLSNVHPEIAGVAVTGGVASLTSALCTPIGAEIAGTAVTGANAFAAGQAITLKAANTTAFLEGAGQFNLFLG